MSRPKGFKLSDDQKAKMQAGRLLRREKAHEGLIDDEPIIKYNKKTSFVIGYGWSKSDTLVFPIFKSETDIYKRKIYLTVEKAREALDRFLSKEHINA